MINHASQIASLGLIALLLLSPSVSAQQDKATTDSAKVLSHATEAEVAKAQNAEALERLQHYLDKTSSLSATFESVVIDADGNAVEDSDSQGHVYIKRPGRFRWEYETPSPFIVLADGVDFWTYDEDMEQAVVRKLSDYRGANPTLLLGARCQCQ